MKKYKALKQERMPFNWCPGCGINIIALKLSEFLEKNDYTNKNTAIISGIGCSGRFAGYFNMDTMHTTHGRAIPTAEGLKLVNPKLNVIVVCGDGDLLSIGLNHTIHSSRRNADIKVICLNNSIYAMTGGQTSPTTQKGWITQTSPNGNKYESINAYKIICKPFNRFFARITPLSRELFEKSLYEAFSRKSFSFIEVVLPCYENDFRRNGSRNPSLALKLFTEKYKDVGYTENLKNNEIGIIKNHGNKR